MINFKRKNKLIELATLVLLVSSNLGINANILAQPDPEQKPEDSEASSEEKRGLSNTDFPENLPDPSSLQNSQTVQSQSSNENPFAPTVVRGTPRRSSPSDIVRTLENDNKFQTLISILELADLNSELEEPEFLVLFAPTEKAFDGLTAELYDRLILPENRGQLIEFIKNHFVIGEIPTDDIERGEIQTLNGNKIRVKLNSNGEVQLNEVTAKEGEFIRTQNGLIVPIDRVLFAPRLENENSITENRSMF